MIVLTAIGGLVVAYLIAAGILSHLNTTDTTKEEK